ncbi:MAG TPA: Ig-like domain-containing protein, partial [Verrucomicrobiae bacterium]|nr:Ig-like domain-containing protein [Verrucomicrobiae bacterium]
GTLIDPLISAPYESETGAGLATNIVVNFEQAGLAAGFIPGDENFPLIDTATFGADPNNIALEALAYLELTAGTHRFGVVSDDAFRVSTGPVLTNANDLILGIFDAGRGATLPAGATEFDFYVEQDGLYPVRLLYDEGQGGASVEFYSVDLNTFERILINDRSNPRAVKAYTGRTAQVFVPTISISAVASGTTNVTISANAALTGGQITRVQFFSGTNQLGESTSSPFSFNWNTVEPGRYTLSAKATGNNGLTATSTNLNLLVGTPLSINFQAPTAELPEGFFADYGDLYGDRGNNHSYGWDVDNTANARDRNSANSPNELYDTFNHLQKPLPAGRVWEIEIPNGRYKVYGASGDPDNFDSVFDVLAEGVTFILGTPDTNKRFYDGSATVTLSDGKLTLSNGPTAANSKINFIDIFELPATDTGKPVLNPPTVSGGNFTVTWTGGGILESTASLSSPVTWTPLPSTGTHTEAINGRAKFFRVRR